MDQLMAISGIRLEGIREYGGRQEPVRILKTPGDVNIVAAQNELTQQAIEKESASLHYTMPLPAETDLAGPLADYAGKGHRAELLGKEVQDGHDCYKIKLSTNAGGTVIFWINTSTWLLSRSLTIYDSDHFRGEILTVYKDYQTINGIAFAYTRETKITRQNGEAETEIIHLNNILLNPATDPATQQA